MEKRGISGFEMDHGLKMMEMNDQIIQLNFFFYL